MRALVLDMGGSHVGCGLVEDRTVLETASIDTVAGSLEALLPVFVTSFQELLRRAGLQTSDCSGVVVGFPGIVDARSGSIRSTLDKYPDACDLDLAGWACEAFGLPIRLENDARLALMGEAFAGAGQGIDNLVMMTLGTGIGTAAMIEGHLLRGVHACAGNLGGHFTVQMGGRRCKCGNIGCAEAESSGWALPEIASSFPGMANCSLAIAANLTFADVFQHAERGDATALAIRSHCLDVWAANAVSLAHAYDPEVLILGGGVMQSASTIVPHIQRYVAEHTWRGMGEVQVRAADLGSSAALIGAIPLLMEHFGDVKN
jgi:glucokinase